MEKRLKYLFGLLIIGFSFVISNSFAIVVEGVTVPVGIEDSSTDFGLSSSYKYDFSYNARTVNGTATPWIRFFGFSTYYNGSIQLNYTPYSNSNYSCPPASYSSILLNNSVFSGVLYTGTCGQGQGNSNNRRYSSNMSNLAWGSSFDSTQRVLLGNGQNFGKIFVYVGTLSDPEFGPKFGFGKGFFSNNDYIEINSNTLGFSPLRIFYYRNSNGSPLDGYNLAGGGGTSDSPFAWQYYTPSGTRYQTARQSTPKNFGDLGGSYSKGSHFGGYGVGYSYGLRTSLSKTITWNDFDFVSVGSKCFQTLMIDGSSDPNSQTVKGCQQIGFLVLKGDSYVTYGNNEPVVVITKDFQNHRQLLYEQFDCYEDSIQRIFDSRYCNSVSHGYLTINGTGNILPFIDDNSTFTLTYGGTGVLDFFLSHFSNGYITHTSNGIVLNAVGNDGFNGSVTFGFNSTPDSISVKDYYNAGLLGYTGTVTPGVSNSGSDVQNSNSLYYQCLGPVYMTPDGLPPAYCYDENGELNAERFKNCSTVIDSSYDMHYYCNIDGTSQEIILEEYGSGYVIVPGESNTNLLDVMATAGYSESYFNNFLNNKGYFFRCPFSYDSNLTVRPKLISLLNGVDINLPLNCMFAGYSEGRNFITNSFDLHIIDNGPLLNMSDEKSLMLYRFIDFILLFGILFMFIRIFKLFK